MDSNDPATIVTPVSVFLRVGHQSTSMLNEKDDPRLCACVCCNIVLMVMTLSQNVCQVVGINTLQPTPVWITLALGLLGAVNDTATYLCTKPQKGGDM